MLAVGLLLLAALTLLTPSHALPLGLLMAPPPPSLVELALHETELLLERESTLAADREALETARGTLETVEMDERGRELVMGLVRGPRTGAVLGGEGSQGEGEAPGGRGACWWGEGWGE